MYTLENDLIIAIIAPLGAELQRLYHKKTNIEHLWKGDATYWGKYSPVLFPIVGSLKDNTYYYNDKPYNLPRHGFAREKMFVVKNLTKTSITFSLTYDESTLQAYPFLFTLEIAYTLQEQALTCTYKVKNIGETEMYFSIGAHPAFAVPFIHNTNYQDYSLEFNNDNILVRYKLFDGLISTTTEELVLTKSQLQLEAKLFYEDAIVLKNLQTNKITLLNNKTKNGFHFRFNKFPYFGIWAAKDAPFICLEPWCGIADSISHNQNLQNKEGINCLIPSGNFCREWSVECF